jgi:hypothetical protein
MHLFFVVQNGMGVIAHHSDESCESHSLKSVCVQPSQLVPTGRPLLGRNYVMTAQLLIGTVMPMVLEQKSRLAIHVIPHSSL